MSFYALVVFCVLFKFSKSFLRPDTEQKYITSVARYPARVGIFFFFLFSIIRERWYPLIARAVMTVMTTTTTMMTTQRVRLMLATTVFHSVARRLAYRRGTTGSA